jgi:hypothetical protein
MKRALLIIAVATLSVGSVGQTFAAGGSIGIFSSSLATDCALTQPAVGTSAQYAIVHVGATGSTGSEAAAPIPPCAAGTVITDIPVVPVYFASVGSGTPSQVGFHAEYGSCRTGAIHIVSMLYQALSPVIGCCAWRVVANPAVSPPPPGPVSLDCGMPPIPEPAAGGTGVVSTNPVACSCSVPTKESTWGVVKELFRHEI